MTLRNLVGRMKECTGCPFSLLCITEGPFSIRQCSECKRVTIHGSMDEGETFGAMIVDAHPCDHMCPAALSSRIFCRHCASDETGEQFRAEPRRIDVFDKLVDSIQKLGEGHEGAMRLLADMVREDKLRLLFSVDDMMLYGEKLWIAYELCHSSKKLFEGRVEVRDKNLIEEVEAVVAARKGKNEPDVR